MPKTYDYHCGRCGGRVTPVEMFDTGKIRFFHALGFHPVYEDPDGMDWRIGHDADPLPGPPTDRRSAVVKPLPDPIYIDQAGYVVVPLSYEDDNREGDPAFNGAFDRW